jgi:hypothetical protein
VKAKSARAVFLQNTDAIKEADAVLTVAKNENANLGVQAGFAYGIEKRIIILTAERDRVPSMLAGMDVEIFRVAELDAIEDYIDQLIRLISSRGEGERGLTAAPPPPT